MMYLKRILAFCGILLITGGICMGPVEAEVAGYVPAGQPFEMAWTPADPPGEAYLVERSLSGEAYELVMSVVLPKYEDTLHIVGQSAQYRVTAFIDVTYTDSLGTHTERVVGPVSDESSTVIAGTNPVPTGGCGKPGRPQLVLP